MIKNLYTVVLAQWIPAFCIVLAGNYGSYTTYKMKNLFFQEKEQEDRFRSLTEEMSTKDDQIESLHNRVKELMGEVESIQSDLDKKTEEVRNFGKKTDEYIRYGNCIVPDHIQA